MKSLLIRATGIFLLLIAAVGCVNTKGESKEGETGTARRPNIVFIISDDHAYQAISAYGSDLLQTPNIDRIAKEGALMEEARVTNSICSPSRAVILTGKYSHVNGMMDNGTFFNGAQQTLPKILGQNGYKTAVVGKWHLFSEPTGFDYWNILPDQGHYYNPEFIKEGKDTVYSGYVTDVITDLAINWIDDNKESPFIMMLQHKAPHRNWMPPLKYLEEFNNRNFKLPETFWDQYKGRKGLQRQMTSITGGFLDLRYDSKIPCDTCPVTEVNHWAPGEFQKEMQRLKPEERKIWDEAYDKEYKQFTEIEGEKEMIEWQFQRYMEDYLRTVKSVDDNVGRLLDYLRKEGLAKNTIVVYMSDQGFYLGEHGLYDKRFMYEESFRTPMMIKYPNVIPEDQRIDEFTLNLDLAPTLLDLAGIKVPEDMQGESMKTLLTKGKDTSWRKEVYYHYYEKSFNHTAHYGIRTERYKLIHFYDPLNNWELFDLQKDPNEMDNLYYDPEYGEIVKELKERLLILQQKYKDEKGLKLNDI